MQNQPATTELDNIVQMIKNGSKPTSTTICKIAIRICQNGNEVTLDIEGQSIDVCDVALECVHAVLSHPRPNQMI